MPAARHNVPEGSVPPFHVIVDGYGHVIAGRLAPIRRDWRRRHLPARGDQHVIEHGGRRMQPIPEDFLEIP
jgi:hypothetical protein